MLSPWVQYIFLYSSVQSGPWCLRRQKVPLRVFIARLKLCLQCRGGATRERPQPAARGTHVPHVTVWDCRRTVQGTKPLPYSTIGYRYCTVLYPCVSGKGINLTVRHLMLSLSLLSLARLNGPASRRCHCAIEPLCIPVSPRVGGPTLVPHLLPLKGTLLHLQCRKTYCIVPYLHYCTLCVVHRPFRRIPPVVFRGYNQQPTALSLSIHSILHIVAHCMLQVISPNALSATACRRRLYNLILTFLISTLCSPRKISLTIGIEPSRIVYLPMTQSVGTTLRKHTIPTTQYLRPYE